MCIFTDSSLIGWGRICRETVKGVWTKDHGRHINALELHAVLLCLRHFHPLLAGKHILVRMDSMTAAAYINR